MKPIPGAVRVVRGTEDFKINHNKEGTPRPMTPIFLVAIGLSFWVSVWLASVLVRRLLASPERRIEDWFGWLERGRWKAGKNQAEQQIRVEKTGFGVLEHGSRRWIEVEWAEVSAVIALKRERSLSGEVCLHFELSDHTSVEVSEDMEGWPALCDELPRRLPSALKWDDWFVPLVQAEHQASGLLLFERAGESAIAPDRQQGIGCVEQVRPHLKVASRGGKRMAARPAAENISTIRGMSLRQGSREGVKLGDNR